MEDYWEMTEKLEKHAQESFKKRHDDLTLGQCFTLVMKKERLQEAFLTFAEALFQEVSENKMVFMVQDMDVKCSACSCEPPEDLSDFIVDIAHKAMSSSKHGYVSLMAPGFDPPMDIAVCKDVLKIPGPVIV